MKRTAVCIVSAVILQICFNAAAEESETSEFTCPERPDKTAKARKLAGTFFSEAEDAFGRELYEEALEKFACSLTMVEHENTIINIERTSAQVKDKRKA